MSSNKQLFETTTPANFSQYCITIFSLCWKSIENGTIIWPIVDCLDQNWIPRCKKTHSSDLSFLEEWQIYNFPMEWRARTHGSLVFVKTIYEFGEWTRILKGRGRIIWLHKITYHISSYSFCPWIVSTHLCTVALSLIYFDLWTTKSKKE